MSLEEIAIIIGALALIVGIFAGYFTYLSLDEHKQKKANYTMLNITYIIAILMHTYNAVNFFQQPITNQSVFMLVFSAFNILFLIIVYYVSIILKPRDEMHRSLHEMNRLIIEQMENIVLKQISTGEIIVKIMDINKEQIHKTTEHIKDTAEEINKSKEKELEWKNQSLDI